MLDRVRSNQIMFEVRFRQVMLIHVKSGQEKIGRALNTSRTQLKGTGMLNSQSSLFIAPRRGDGRLGDQRDSGASYPLTDWWLSGD